MPSNTRKVMEIDLGAILQRTQEPHKPVFTYMQRMLSPRACKVMRAEWAKLTSSSSRDRRRSIASRSALFANYELLELILLQLPTTLDLIRARRVCQSWHNLISRSRRLQRHLFLTAEPVPKRWREVADAYSPERGFLLARTPLRAIMKLRITYRCHNLPDFRLHPALANTFPSWWYGPWGIPLICKLGEFRNKDMLSWKPGQWQDMFLTQPPVKRLLVFDCASHWSRYVTLYDADGLRLGAFVKWVRSRKHHSMQLDNAKQAWLEAFYRDCKEKYEPLGIIYLPGKYWRD